MEREEKITHIINSQRLRLYTLTSLILLFCTVSGCSFVGPASISQGRLNYAEAINQTEDQQLLLSIVKGRYDETSTLLLVNSVAANIRFRASIDDEFAVGPKTYMDDLVPLSTSVAYEENPTITYSPVKGEQYIKQFMSPIPLDILMVVLRSETRSGNLLRIMVNRVNDMHNPDFLDAVMNTPAGQFERFTELFELLQHSGVLDMVKDQQEDVAFDLLINEYAPNFLAEVTEFVELLDMPMPTEPSESIVIPVYFGIHPKELKGIGITTRSTFDLIEIMRASIVVPQEHIDTGLTQEFPPMGLPGQGIRISTSKTKPGNRSLAVKYRDYWFYIDERDHRTKRFFLMMGTLWSISSSHSEIGNEVPVMTIPVSR